MNNLTQFEEHVIESLARLETQMKSLIGNGQPGRIARIERAVFLLIVGGITMAVTIWGPSVVSWLFK